MDARRHRRRAWIGGLLVAIAVVVAFLLPREPAPESRPVARSAEAGVQAPERKRPARAAASSPSDEETPGADASADSRATGSIEVRIDPPRETESEILLWSEEGEIRRPLPARAASLSFDDLALATWQVRVQAFLGDGHSGWTRIRPVAVVKDTRTVVTFAFTGDRAISGVVRDDAGVPVGGSDVIWTSDGSMDWTMTSADGAFRLEGLPYTRGELVVRDRLMAVYASARTHAPLQVPDVFPGGPHRELTVRRLQLIRGRVLPPEVRSLAWVIDGAARSQGVTKTKANGSFGIPVEMDLVPFLCIRSERSAPVIFENLTVPQGGMIDLGVLDLDSGATLEGTLRDESGAPIAGVQISETGQWAMRNGFASTDASGRFRLERLPRRPIPLFVHGAASRAAWRLTVDPSAGDAVLTVGSGIVVRGHFPGAPAGAEACLVWPPEVGVNARQVTVPLDAEGRFSARVQPGRWTVAVEDGDGNRLSEASELDLAVDGTEITLRPR